MKCSLLCALFIAAALANNHARASSAEQWDAGQESIYSGDVWDAGQELTDSGDVGDTGQEITSSGLLTGRLTGENIYQRACSAMVLYADPSNPWVQSVSLMAQLQIQYAYGSAAQGKFGTQEWPDDLSWGNSEVRRFRLGLRGRLFGDVSFFNLTDLEPDFSNGVYKRIPETFVTWHRSPKFNVAIGKCELKFNREQEYSSTQFPAFERTAVANMLYAGELSGIWIYGDQIDGGWLYFLSVYSNDRQDEWPEFDGAGAIFLSKLGYDYTPATTLDRAVVKFQWLHNTRPGYTNSKTNPPSPLYSNSFSLSNEVQAGKLGFTAELLFGDGAQGRPDVAAFSTMTTWSFSERIELINVTEVAGSRKQNGVILPTRYEALAPDVGDRRGDAWFSSYAGVNYYIDGHNVKLMTGAKYSTMNGGTNGGNFNGWTWLFGLRMFFY